MPALVELYSRPGCHLCEIAKQQLLEVKDEVGFGLIEIDITESEALFEEYGEQIPVILINGEFFARFEVDKTSLKKRLSNMN